MSNQPNPDNLILLKDHGNGIVVMTMNDPPRRNALSEAMMDALQNAHEKIKNWGGLRVVIVTGAGEAFSAGGDISDMVERKGIFNSENPLEAREINLRSVHKIPAAVYGIEVPTIAAVNGHAIGGGCDVAAMCDLRIASENAVFGESFLRVGLVPGDGGAWFLPRVVGLAHAMELALTADFVDAQQALRMGLVSRVTAHDALMGEALRLAERIARHPPTITRMTKRLMRFGMEASLSDTLELTANMQAQAQTSTEHRDAARRLHDTRPRRRSGR